MAVSSDGTSPPAATALVKVREFLLEKSELGPRAPAGAGPQLVRGSPAGLASTMLRNAPNGAERPDAAPEPRRAFIRVSARVDAQHHAARCVRQELRTTE